MRKSIFSLEALCTCGHTLGQHKRGLWGQCTGIDCKGFFFRSVILCPCRFFRTREGLMECGHDQIMWLQGDDLEGFCAACEPEKLERIQREVALIQTYRSPLLIGPFHCLVCGREVPEGETCIHRSEDHPAH